MNARRFILDTNVVAELMRPRPDPAVLAWVNGRASSTLYLTATTIAEILTGIAILPEGQKRRQLEQAFESRVEAGFPERVLGFDREAAHHFSAIFARRRAMGGPLSMADGQIAAIASSRRLAVATRNVRDFESCDLDLANPWDPERSA